MPVYDEKLICPFAVRFSQARIRPTFQDGHSLQTSLDETAFSETVGTPAHETYDVLLDAPFPSIEIVRWKPKLREEDGTPIEDETGANVFGEACWFTLDNRRLYCLQSAASRCWPRRVAATVRVLHTSALRNSVTKFQTTTAGRCVLISRRHDPAVGTWDWVEATRSKGAEPASVLAGLRSVKSDCDTSTFAALWSAPEPGPVRAAVLAKERREQGLQATTTVSVATLFELASGGAKSSTAEPDPESNPSSPSSTPNAKGQELMSLLGAETDKQLSFTGPNGCIDWSLLLASAAEAGETLPDARRNLNSSSSHGYGMEGYREGKCLESCFNAVEDAKKTKSGLLEELFDNGWLTRPASSQKHGCWSESSWNEATWAEQGEDEWYEDSDWAAGDDAAWSGKAWDDNEEAMWALQNIAGKWVGAKNEVYTVEEGSWTVTRSDNRGRRTFTLTWDASLNVIRWGEQFYLSQGDSGAGCIKWVHHRNSQRSWIWKRKKKKN